MGHKTGQLDGGQLTICFSVYKLFMNVGTVVSPWTVLSVKTTGPKPTIPSTLPLKPFAVAALPKDCLWTVRPAKDTYNERNGGEYRSVGERSTQGVTIRQLEVRKPTGPTNSSPETSPEPYAIENDLPIFSPQVEGTFLDCAPAYMSTKATISHRYITTKSPKGSDMWDKDIPTY